MNKKWRLSNLLFLLILNIQPQMVQATTNESSKPIILADNIFYNISDLNNSSSLISQKSIKYSLNLTQILTLDESSKPILDAHAKFLNQHKEIKVILESHTASSGSKEFSLSLGYKNAHALKKILVSLGASDEQIEVISYGEQGLGVNQIDFNYPNK